MCFTSSRFLFALLATTWRKVRPPRACLYTRFLPSTLEVFVSLTRLIFEPLFFLLFQSHISHCAPRVPFFLGLFSTAHCQPRKSSARRRTTATFEMSIWDSDNLGIIAERVSWGLFAVAACKFHKFLLSRPVSVANHIDKTSPTYLLNGQACANSECDTKSLAVFECIAASDITLNKAAASTWTTSSRCSASWYSSSFVF